MEEASLTQRLNINSKSLELKRLSQRSQADLKKNVGRKEVKAQKKKRVRGGENRTRSGFGNPHGFISRSIKVNRKNEEGRAKAIRKLLPFSRPSYSLRRTVSGRGSGTGTTRGWPALEGGKKNLFLRVRQKRTASVKDTGKPSPRERKAGTGRKQGRAARKDIPFAGFCKVAMRLSTKKDFLEEGSR